MKTKLILFDIDGTLVLTGGAGARGMTRAFEETWGVSNALARVDVAGRTDSIILADALRLTERDGTPDEIARFREVYQVYLREELDANGHGRPKGELPGVRALLDVLVERPDVSLALLTGNFPEAAEIKLDYFDLWRYFPWGVFGDEAMDRHDLLPVALRRHRDRAGVSADIDPADVIIIGDTPHDVSCAQRGGARAVAVATGSFDVTTLGRCQPDVVCADLADPAPFFALLER